MNKIIALVVAAGRGQRFGGELPKQYRWLCGQPVLRRTVSAFTRHPAVAGAVVVVDPTHMVLARAALDGTGARLVSGAATRQESVLAGLEAMAAEEVQPDAVLIHDGARPLIDEATISRVVAALETEQAAIAGIPVTDTLKCLDHDHCGDTVDRSTLIRAQTPQGFRFATILSAHREAHGQALTDDAAVAALSGIPVIVVPGADTNIKITTPPDFSMAERLISGMEAPPAAPRVGQGFDVHRLVPGKGMRLCGVWLPGPQSLSGHSDADVALHALTDALLGALADGDIGSHFPPSDPRWAGADSAGFLTQALKRARTRGYRPSNVDVTLICEQPKIGPHRPAMTERLAALLDLAHDAVSVKATTAERLGFTGRKEGIAAMATAVLAQSERDHVA